jgi:nicotinamide mononucleotide (NMN) deamidase PncC
MNENVTSADLDYVQIDGKLVECAVKALERAKEANLEVVMVESCTGGLVATALSETPGAAEYLEGASSVPLPDPV